jgi:hypothetical protein
MVKTGTIYVTNGVHHKQNEDEKFNGFVAKSLGRHLVGDWGDLDEDDKRANDFALRNGDDILLSKYTYDDGTKIYILTEWDRSYTTIMFPEEY